jgi:hypothetical protein
LRTVLRSIGRDELIECGRAESRVGSTDRIGLNKSESSEGESDAHE